MTISVDTTTVLAEVAASDAAGRWLTEHGLAERFAGLAPELWAEFIRVTTEAYQDERERLEERAAIKAADGVPS